MFTSWHSTDSDRDCNQVGYIVEKVVDKLLNEEDIEIVVDVKILAAKKAQSHSLNRTGYKDGELSNPKVHIVENSSKESTKVLSDHGSLAMLRGGKTSTWKHSP